MCADHWEKLKDAIKARGIYHLVKDAKGVHAEVVEAVEKGENTSTPDPLFAAHNMIVSNCLNVAGLEIMQPNADGSERCPLCYLLKNCPCGEEAACPFNTWIDRAADGALALVSQKEAT